MLASVKYPARARSDARFSPRPGDRRGKIWPQENLAFRGTLITAATPKPATGKTGQRWESGGRRDTNRAPSMWHARLCLRVNDELQPKGNAGEGPNQRSNLCRAGNSASQSVRLILITPLPCQGEVWGLADTRTARLFPILQNQLMVAPTKSISEQLYDALQIARAFHGGTLTKAQWIETVGQALEEIMIAQKQRAPRAAKAAAVVDSDEGWRKSLATNPAYAGIDVEREFAKMGAWCQLNRKQPSRRRFLNWLNRADCPMAGVANGTNPHQRAAPTAEDHRKDGFEV